MRVEPEVAAATMLKRYSSPYIAAEMAHFHGMDYAEGTDNRKYWERVKSCLLGMSAIRPAVKESR